MGLLLAFGVEVLDLLAGLLQTPLQTLLAAKRATAGTGPHPQAVLRDAVQARQALIQERRHAWNQQLC